MALNKNKFNLLRRYASWGPGLALPLTVAALMLPKIGRSEPVRTKVSKCESTLANRNSPAKEKQNGDQSANDYQQMNARGLTDYEQILGDEFTAQARTLSRSDLFVDSGSGLGIAARTLGLNTGAKVLMINPQDYSNLFDSLRTLKQQYQAGYLKTETLTVISDPETGYPKAISTRQGLLIEVNKIKLALKTLNQKIPPALVFSEQPQRLTELEYQKLLTELLVTILENEAFFRTREDFRVGFTESVLPQYENQAQLIADLYGAFFYSPQRLKILTSMYQALTSSGRAFIYLGKGIELEKNKDSDWLPPMFSSYGGDVVTLSDGNTKISFIDWLVRRHPQIFQLQERHLQPEWTLIMRRSPEKKSLSLDEELELVTSSYYTYRDDGFIVPKLEFREK